MRVLQDARKALWHFTGRPAGAHAVALTEERSVILVRLTYANGWRIPGGGVKKNETFEQAVLRELREEIGMTSFRDVQELGNDSSLGRLYVVRGVEYCPKQSVEIEAVQSFSLADLPPDMSPRTRRWLEKLKDEL